MCCTHLLPDSRLVVGCADHSINVWDVQLKYVKKHWSVGSHLMMRFTGHKADVCSLASFSSGGPVETTTLVSGSIDGVVCTWDLSNRVALKSVTLKRTLEERKSIQKWIRELFYACVKSESKVYQPIWSTGELIQDKVLGVLLLIKNSNSSKIRLFKLSDGKPLSSDGPEINLPPESQLTAVKVINTASSTKSGRPDSGIDSLSIAIGTDIGHVSLYKFENRKKLSLRCETLFARKAARYPATESQISFN